MALWGDGSDGVRQPHVDRLSISSRKSLRTNRNADGYDVAVPPTSELASAACSPLIRPDRTPRAHHQGRGQPGWFLPRNPSQGRPRRSPVASRWWGKVRPNRTRSAIADVESSQDGQWLATSSNDGVLRVWAQDGTECSVHNGPIADVAIGPDGDRIATIGAADRPQGSRVHHGLAHRFRTGGFVRFRVPEQNRKHLVSRPREACSTRRRRTDPADRPTRRERNRCASSSSRSRPPSTATCRARTVRWTG
ncbi:hypothetical protein AB0L13_42395 [Saccharopolyspora shandongensis]|uniref:hypothetical protein n=1 Tax=Saccharopolyspora shandongensis TaxID=418495 RepID=UPI0034367A60